MGADKLVVGKIVSRCFAQRFIYCISICTILEETLLFHTDVMVFEWTVGSWDRIAQEHYEL